ncbi:hypothetical protein B484DRAFT_404615 [Ochromonadaceae sp. CCMP2298]|nr:hypothetical protein B484DRAFT_404615 [Ochromonadaceae sp. CCMP2298]
MASSITSVVYMGLKEGVQQGPLMVPLPIIVYMAWGRIHKKFHALSSAPAYRLAVADKGGEFSADFFQAPALSAPLLPQAYRLGVPLLEKGQLQAEYYQGTPVQLQAVLGEAEAASPRSPSSPYYQAGEKDDSAQGDKDK